jgi:hypothetical protein
MENAQDGRDVSSLILIKPIQPVRAIMLISIGATNLNFVQLVYSY